MEPRYLHPQPVPVSGPPSQLARPPSAAQANDEGPKYGIQSFHQWQAGQFDERPLLDVRKAPFLWRVSIIGRVTVRIVYGTSSTKEMRVQSPVVIALPGQVQAWATPLDQNGADATVTLTQASAGARAIARRFITGPAAAFDVAAHSYTALTASVLLVSGVAAIAVPALSSIPLVAGSVLTSGSGFQEFEP